MELFDTTRLIVVPVIRDATGRFLLCRMPPDRGVFPDQWALPGGGVEPGEVIRAALEREVREELGVRLVSAVPLFFKDGIFEKSFAGGEQRPIYMVFLLFDCRLADDPIQLNEEFVEYAWVSSVDLPRFDLNPITVDTFRQLGILPGPAAVEMGGGLTWRPN